MTIKMFVVMKRKLSLFNLYVILEMLCLSFMNETRDIVSLSKFNVDVDSGKWNRNRNAMFTQDEMTTASTTISLCFLSTLFLYIHCV